MVPRLKHGRAPDDLASVEREVSSLSSGWRQALPLIETLGNSLECGLLLIDDRNEVVFASEAFGVMLGMTASQVRALTPEALVAYLCGLVDDPPQRLREGKVLAGPHASIVCEEFAIARPAESVVRWVARRLETPLRGQVVVCTDISAEQRLADSVDNLKKTQRQLMEVSRLAGMADVATTVLHNVGNVLNSVNVSAGLVLDRIRNAKVSGLGKAVKLLREQPSGPENKTPQLLEYLTLLAASFEEDAKVVQSELLSLQKNIDHIKAIVAMQQSHARVTGGVEEKVMVSALVEDALKTLNMGGADDKRAAVTRDYQDGIRAQLDRHKLLQILMNLLRNAVDAMMTSEQKRITIRLRTGTTGRFVLEVQDTGCGIPPDRLTIIFQYGFSTKRSGHGFGLHGSANLATEMGGTLTVRSDGVGRGATFVLDLPLLSRHSSAEHPALSSA
jgi:two-component system, NtrC family, sensor kinase